MSASERDFNQDIFGRNGPAQLFGWRTYRTMRSRGSNPGYPDQTCVRRSDRLLFAELKKDARSRPTESQREWLTMLAMTGQEVYLWRPEDTDEIVEVLRWRWTLNPSLDLSRQAGLIKFAPASQWIFSDGVGGRRDEL